MPVLSAEQRESVLRRLDFLRIEVGDIASFNDMTHTEYARNRDRRRNLERLAENVVNVTIDVSKIMLSAMNLPVPDTYREVVVQTGVAQILDKSLTDRLAEMVRLRNVLAHQYLDIRWAALRRFIDEAPALMQSFINAIRRSLDAS